MTLKHVLKLFSKTEVQEDKTHPCHLSQTILNRLFGRVLKKEGVSISCAKHTEKNLSSNRPIVLMTLKKAAFTLAEVLITLGIIGVVAALTLPTLIANHKKQTYVNQLKKVVNTLENAAQMAVAQEGVSSFKDTKVYSRFMDYYSCLDNCTDITEDILNSLNIKYVSIDKSNKDYSSDYKEFDGSALSTGVLKNPVSVVDGSILYFWRGYITVDVNGKKAPNQIGRDTFHLGYNYYNKGLLTDYDYSYDCLNAEENSYLEQGCYLKKIVADGWKMNY